MSISRALSGAFNCRICRRSALGSCLAPTGIPLLLPQTISQRPRSLIQTRSIARVNVQSTRHFTSLHANRSGRQDHDEENVIEDANVSFEKPTSEGSIPWYLRVQDVEPENTLLERQRLPELPEDAPYQLTEILNHLSDGIGLEYLTLLDLRALDPPPALGSNLIMLIGTARSIRHLNVSADRLCRWLRSTYKLSPHADGLLGRNELKLKLRRRARRAKTLGSKLRPSDGDDGITTGWICVNVGALGDGAATDQLVRSDDGSVIGFGQDNPNTHIVVQLLTEEKRESLDLEGLWRNYLDRQQRRLERTESEAESDEQHEQPAVLPPDNSEAISNEDAKAVGPSPSLEQSTSIFRVAQKREFHSMVSLPARRLILRSRTKLQESLGHSQTISRHLVHSNATEFTESIAAQNLMQQVLNLPSHEAIISLGTGWNDKTSTPFLTSFYSEIETLPTIDHYRARLALAHLAMDLQHPSYNVDSFVDILKEACESLVAVPEDLFQMVVDQFARIEPQANPNETDAKCAAEQLTSLLSILDDMSLRGMNLSTPNIIESLFDTILTTKRVDPEAAAQYLTPYPLAQLAILADEHNLSLSQGSHCLAAFEDLVKGRKWDDVWRVWAWFPIREQRRPPELYAAVFRMMAATKHQKACMEALTKMVPTMELETPPVEVKGDTAAALMECLKVADPTLQPRYAHSEVDRQPWSQLFQICVDGLKSSPTEQGDVSV